MSHVDGHVEGVQFGSATARHDDAPERRAGLGLVL
jgi:hypothetical protein